MALTMLDKTAEKKDKSRVAGRDRRRIRARSQEPESLRRLHAAVGEPSARGYGSSASPPASASDFHRHVLDYFWTAVYGGRGRQHVHDGTTVEYTYAPGETRHETYGKGEFKVHDLENLGDKEMVFMTVEFKDSANKPMPLPEGVRPQAAA